MDDAERYQQEYDRMMQRAEDLAHQSVNISVETVWRRMEKPMNDVYERFGLTEAERLDAQQRFRLWLTEYITQTK